MPPEKIQVVKLPASTTNDSQPPKKPFPKMPRLYLELLENKRKIKPELVNKEFVSSSKNEEYDNEKDNDREIEREQNHSDSDADREHESSPPMKFDVDFNNEDDFEFSEQYNSDQPKNGSNFFKMDNTREDSKNSSKDASRDVSRHSSRQDSRHSDSSRDRSVSRSDVPSTPRTSVSSNSSKKDSRVTDRLKELLDGDDDDMVSPNIGKPQALKLPPSLAELEKSGQITRTKEAIDVGDLSENDTEDLKREYIFKFELLKKSFMNANIPEFTIHSDLQSMKKTYESTLRMLTLDRTVDQYKQYLTYGFGMVEFLLGSVFNFDMAGFSAQQQINMSQYEYLLVELGEKSYVPTGSKYPVEVRLLFMIILNTAFFLVTKIVLRKTGVNLSTSQTAAPQASQSTQPKKKMRGPVVNVDDIPDV